MLHAFFDTNIFLSLYAYTDDNLEELRKVIQLVKTKELKLYITTTVNQEFWRNRDKKVVESLGNLRNFSTSLSIPRFMEHLPEAEEIRNLLSQVASKRKALIAGAEPEVADRTLAADKLFSEIRDASDMIVADNFEAAATKRMERGNPPGKDGSIGDRINWEVLLKKVPLNNDIHVVSRDKDFSSPLGKEVPNSYLGEEWARTKKGKMYVYYGIKSFVKQHFSSITLQPDLDKAISLKALKNSKSFSQTHSAIASLLPLLPDVTDDEAIELSKALVDNYEIHAIAGDDDVKAFYQTIMINHYEALDDDLYNDMLEFVSDPLPF